jgi:hypothetical protein
MVVDRSVKSISGAKLCDAPPRDNPGGNAIDNDVHPAAYIRDTIIG